MDHGDYPSAWIDRPTDAQSIAAATWTRHEAAHLPTIQLFSAIYTAADCSNLVSFILAPKWESRYLILL
jgi:hypothetical protein